MIDGMTKMGNVSLEKINQARLKMIGMIHKLPGDLGRKESRDESQ